MLYEYGCSLHGIGDFYKAANVLKIAEAKCIADKTNLLRETLLTEIYLAASWLHHDINQPLSCLAYLNKAKATETWPMLE